VSLTPKQKLEALAWSGFNVGELELIPQQTRLVVTHLLEKDFSNAAIAAEHLHSLTAELLGRCDRAKRFRGGAQ
jgi:hypothetical protein